VNCSKFFGPNKIKQNQIKTNKLDSASVPVFVGPSPPPAIPLPPPRRSNSAMAPTTTGMTQGGDRTDVVNLEDLIVSPNEVLRDGRMSGEAALQIFRKFHEEISKGFSETQVHLAIACCYGTSTETNFRERLLWTTDRATSMMPLIHLLEVEPSLASRRNKLRVFCRSLPGFPKLTRDVIHANPWLQAKLAAERGVDVQFGGVCFDYADALNDDVSYLTVAEQQVMQSVARRNVGEGRPALITGDTDDDGAARGPSERVAPLQQRAPVQSSSNRIPFGGSMS